MLSDICNHETGNFEVSPKVVFVHICLDQDHNLLVRTIPKNCRVSTESVPLRNVNLMNPNRFALRSSSCIFT